MSIQVWVDSSAAKAVAGRVGAGKLRHVQVTHLWIQGHVKNRKQKVKKIKGENNPSDILTKPKFIKEMSRHFGNIGVKVESLSIDRNGLEEECEDSNR